MLLWFISFLHRHVQVLHALSVFQYLSFRAIVSALTALLLVFVFSPRLITTLQRFQIGQTVRELGPESHYKKTGTPTMGGLLMIFAVVLSVLLWGDLGNAYLWLMLLVYVSFALIGGIDDFRKVVRRNTEGLPARWKFFWQSIVALAVSVLLYVMIHQSPDTQVVLPFFKNAVIHLGLLYIVLSYFVIVGTSNAVNLTDGLDGLALLPSILVLAALGVFAYVSGNTIFAHYLMIPYIPGTGELVVFCAALLGAGFGFLWYNTYPAEIFMGDVGSLSLGAVMGVLAVIVRQEILLFVMGGVFVVETLSVMIQVAYFKRTGRRVFKMAPIHHHFELLGWSEPKIIVRFWIVTFILVLLSLATIKLR